MGLRCFLDYVYYTLAEKNLKVFIRLKKSANIVIVPESINIYRFKAIIELKCQISRSLCVYVYLHIVICTSWTVSYGVYVIFGAASVIISLADLVKSVDILGS